jgi:hypothetical protein
VEKIKRRYSQPSMSSTLQLLLEEKLREEEYGYIIFRDAAGRTAFLEGTGLAVWEVMMIARCYGYDVAKTAEHLVIREDLVRLAMEYASDHREEVYAQLAENDAMDFEALKRILPNIELFTVPADAEIESEATEAG